MTNGFDDSKIVQKVKGVAIFLVIVAVFSFFIGSGKIAHFSETNPVMYQINYSQLSNTGKTLASSMKKTCEVQSKLLGPSRGNGNGGSKFFDQVGQKHSSRR